MYFCRFIFLGVLSLVLGEDVLQELKGEKPHVLKVVAAESSRPKHGLEVRMLQRHGRAPLPPEPNHIPTSEAEIMQEFDEVIVEWKTNLLVRSILLRLPEKRQQLADFMFDGYQFFTGQERECKFERADKHVLPDNHTQRARNLADSNEISSCIVDNGDTSGDAEPRRSSALLKFYPHPFEHNAIGWRYFSIMIRNAQTTPQRTSVDGREANTFQIVMNTTDGETVASMSFEALPIKTIWVCSYTPWFTSTPCTADCGGGFRTHFRRLLHAPPVDYDPKLLKNCHEKTTDHYPCNTQVCDVDCQLGDWTPWANGECSRSCGSGTMVERRNVLMSAKGNGRICPPWSAGERVRTLPCNTAPCPASCEESPLLALHNASSKSDSLVFKNVPRAGVSTIKANAAVTDDPDDSQPEEEDTNATSSMKQATPKPTSEGQEQEEEQAEEEEHVDDVQQSFSLLEETPRMELGLSKSSCSAPCGGGRRLVTYPSESKVSSGNEDKSCYTAVEKKCNVFECRPLMLQPASAWQFPVLGKWFMVDAAFELEELAESLTLRAPSDFFLAAAGDSNGCFLVEHNLPNLENCTIYPGQTSDATGPILVLDFSNPLEPQNSYLKTQDWYYMRFWVQHPEKCTGGKTSDGRCLGLAGERQWTLSVKMDEPNKLWAVVKGSYEIFVDEKSARATFEANEEKGLPFTDEAKEVESPEQDGGEVSESDSRAKMKADGEDSLIEEPYFFSGTMKNVHRHERSGHGRHHGGEVHAAGPWH